MQAERPSHFCQGRRPVLCGSPSERRWKESGLIREGQDLMNSNKTAKAHSAQLCRPVIKEFLKACLSRWLRKPWSLGRPGAASGEAFASGSVLLLEGHHQQLFFLVQSAWHSWLTLGPASPGCREGNCLGPAGSLVKGHKHSEDKIKVVCGLSWNLQGWLEA